MKYTRSSHARRARGLRTKCARSRGFTLVEAMIIVVIIGVLSAIAIPTYTGYLYRSKTTEAVGFLAAIKARQEDYKSLYQEYCNVSGDETQWWPALDTLGASPRSWNGAGRPAGWSQLGVSPPGQETYFSYLSVAGGIGEELPSIASEAGYDNTDFWFISRAVGDLNGDGVRITFESYSHRQSLWISSERGWE